MHGKNIVTISGKVVKGDGYGQKLGFPTVNLDLNVLGLIAPGVYIGSVILEKKNYRAGIAVNPEGKIDAHLIGYNGDAYGKEVTLQLETFLREYKKFNTEEELKIQIKKDIDIC